ncbi:MAG: AraC family transcriptional regulator [Xanthobacteraceae bacterium]|jgi:AraC family transcriptional regulator
MAQTRPNTAVAPHRSALLRRDIAGFTVTLLPALPYEVTYVSDHHIIGFTFERQEGVDAFAADRRRPFRADPWRLAFTPAGCQVYSASKRGGEYLILSVAPETFARLAPRYERGRLPQFTNVSDAWFTPLGMALRRIACSSEVIDGLHFEALAAAAVERLAAQIDGSTAVTDIASGITPRRMKRILDYLDAYLDTNVRLADLARHIGLSDAYLARAFRAATGTTLHAALVERRIARARWLMNRADRHRRDMSLAAVAAESGFSSHAHMATAFRRVLGTTPSHWAKVAAQYSNE